MSEHHFSPAGGGESRLASAGFLLSAALAAISIACGGSGSTGPPVTPPPPPPPPPSPITTGILGYLPGDNQAFGLAVNALGHVAGWSGTGNDERTSAFYWDGILRNLTPSGGSARALGISSGTPIFVVGTQNIGGTTQAVRWAPATSLVPSVLETIESSANAVNDGGTAVGNYRPTISQSIAVIWATTQRIEVPPFPGDASSSAVAINNQDIVVGTSFPASSTAPNRAWVRLLDGRVLPLTLAGDDLGASAGGLSDVVNGQFTVVGTATTVAGTTRAVRWTVNATTGSMTVDAPSGLRSAYGVSRSGAIAGNTVTQAILWRNGTSLALVAGAGSTVSRGISETAAGVIYVVGYAPSPPSAAVLWTIR